MSSRRHAKSSAHASMHFFAHTTPHWPHRFVALQLRRLVGAVAPHDKSRVVAKTLGQLQGKVDIGRVVRKQIQHLLPGGLKKRLAVCVVALQGKQTWWATLIPVGRTAALARRFTLAL